ncbi:3'(2'),5'-bisphosphate nucleotidase CysQ [Gynuella sp.]|uniref:3'(2'),5'-bisphosphate nucleotidase CysQ n=1 Tax=Gynuella sp. TaxID=2969146 RepID=UPI003D0C603C
MENLIELVPELVEICQRASNVILAIYDCPENYDIQAKSDESPVTAADLAANDVILEGLTRLTPEIPIMSEESIIDWEERKSWQRYWLVDPLDGTKDFIAHNGEFCIAIALMDLDEPLLGFIFQPVTGDYYWGSRVLGSFHGRQRLHGFRNDDNEFRVVGSRRLKHRGPWFEWLQQTDFSIQRIQQGSALKFCRLAEGQADLYPRIGPTCEWDTAAGQAILEGAGGLLVDSDGRRFRYNKPQLLNPHFYALRDPRWLSNLLAL